MKWAPDASTVKQALAAHAAIGLIAGALLYIVCLTGTVLVFYEEWQRIEQPHVPEMSALGPAAAQRGLEAVLVREAGKPKSDDVYVQLPTAKLPRAAISTDHQNVYLAKDGSIVGPKQVAWSDFLYALHYTLQIPGIWGITIVGGLGAMILALSLSGVIAHPRIFRDAFRLRARDGGGIALADWHNRLSVWTLPFAVAVAFTGAVIGLATLSANGIAARYYHGDDDLTYAPVFGGEPAENLAPAPVPNLAAALGYMQAHYPAVTVTGVTLAAPGTAGQQIEVIGEHRHRLIFGEYYDFDGAGNFRRIVGLSDGDLGQQAAASTYDLHFGNYGGPPVKIAYFVFGLALTAIVATGTYIWLGKRRRRGHRATAPRRGMERSRLGRADGPAGHLRHSPDTRQHRTVQRDLLGLARCRHRRKCRQSSRVNRHCKHRTFAISARPERESQPLARAEPVPSERTAGRGPREKASPAKLRSPLHREFVILLQIFTLIGA